MNVIGITADSIKLLSALGVRCKKKSKLSLGDNGNKIQHF